MKNRNVRITAIGFICLSMCSVIIAAEPTNPDCSRPWLEVWFDGLDYEIPPMSVAHIGEPHSYGNDGKAVVMLAPLGFRAKWKFTVQVVRPGGKQLITNNWIEFDTPGVWKLSPTSCPNHILTVNVGGDITVRRPSGRTGGE